MDSVFSSVLSSFNTAVTPDRDCLSLIVRYLANAEDHPGEEKYRQIRKGNARFNSVVWSREEGRSLMLLAGFEEEGDFVKLPLSASCAVGLESVRAALGSTATSGGSATSAAAVAAASASTGIAGSGAPAAATARPTPAGTLRLSKDVLHQQGSSGFVPPNMELLQTLTQCGFELDSGKAALSATHNRSIGAAIDWLQAHPNWRQEFQAGPNASHGSCPVLANATAAAGAPHQAPAATQGQSSAATATSTEESSSVYIPTKFQEALDKRHERAEQKKRDDLQNARKEKVAKLKAKRDLQDQMELEKKHRAAKNAERMEQIFRSQGRTQDMPSTRGMMSSFTAGGSVASNGTHSSTATALSSSAAGSAAGQCTLRIRYQDGQSEMLRLTAEDTVGCVYEHASTKLGMPATSLLLVALHNRSKLEDHAATLVSAGLTPQGVITVSSAGAGQMKQGGGKVVSLHAVTSLAEWGTLVGQHVLYIVLFHRRGDAYSERALQDVQEVCAEMMQEGSLFSQATHPTPKFLSVDFDDLRVIAQKYNVVQVPVILPIVVRRVMGRGISGGPDVNMKEKLLTQMRDWTAGLRHQQHAPQHHDDDEDDDDDDTDSDNGEDNEAVMDVEDEEGDSSSSGAEDSENDDDDNDEDM